VISKALKLVSGGRAQWLTPVIPATQEVEIRRIAVQGQSKQKVRDTPPPSQQKKLGRVVHPCYSNHAGNIRKITVQASLGKNMRFFSKITKVSEHHSSRL
jgi:hypothetical protein